MGRILRLATETGAYRKGRIIIERNLYLFFETNSFYPVKIVAAFYSIYFFSLLLKSFVFKFMKEIVDFSLFFANLYVMLSDNNSVMSESPETKPKTNLLSIIKQIVLKREYNSLQPLCLDYVTNNNLSIALPELWESIEYLTRPTIGLTPYAKSISLFFFEHLLHQSYYKEALDHIRHTGNLVEPDRKLRQKIVELYKNQHNDIGNLDVFTRLSGIAEAKPLSQAITTLDKLIGLSVGNPVYSSRFGYGEVSKIDFILDTITLNFFTNQTQTFTFEQALKSLQLIPKDNFHYLKLKNRSIITEMIKENPQELEKILKRDIGSHIRTTDIKQALTYCVSDENIKSFIEYLKKSYAQSKPKTTKEVSKKEFSVDYDVLLSMQSEKIIELISKAPNITKQKIILSLNKRNDWQELSMKLFLSQSDKRVLQTIFSGFSNETQQQVNDKLLTEYKQYPIQFLFISETVKLSNAYAILTRYLDLVRSHINLEKVSIAGEIRRRLITQDYEIIKKSVEQITSDIAKRTLSRIQEIKNLYPEERERIEKIFKEKFPEIFTQETEWIYSTENAIKNKTEELEKLISEEIPTVAAEIGRARGYGDLRENFEYKAAKEKQKRLLAQVSQMQHDLVKARPIDFNKIDTTKVNIGATIKLASTQESNSYLTYTILGPWDSDVQKGIISYLAPFAQHMLNKLPGDEITDSEGKTYKIIEITKTEV